MKKALWNNAGIIWHIEYDIRSEQCSHICVSGKVDSSFGWGLKWVRCCMVVWYDSDVNFLSSFWSLLETLWAVFCFCWKYRVGWVSISLEFSFDWTLNVKILGLSSTWEALLSEYGQDLSRRPNPAHIRSYCGNTDSVLLWL